MKLIPADLQNPQLVKLLEYHLQEAHRLSPPESVFALDVSGLAQPEISLFCVEEDGQILGCGALKELSPAWGEIKSMRTHPDHLRRGVASRILEYLISLARERGYEKLSLETGPAPGFAAALKLYAQHGFTKGESYGDYPESDFSQFLHLKL